MTEQRDNKQPPAGIIAVLASEFSMLVREKLGTAQMEEMLKLNSTMLKESKDYPTDQFLNTKQTMENAFLSYTGAVYDDQEENHVELVKAAKALARERNFYY